MLFRTCLGPHATMGDGQVFTTTTTTSPCSKRGQTKIIRRVGLLSAQTHCQIEKARFTTGRLYPVPEIRSCDKNSPDYVRCILINPEKSCMLEWMIPYDMSQWRPTHSRDDSVSELLSKRKEVSRLGYMSNERPISFSYPHTLQWNSHAITKGSCVLMAGFA